MTISKVDSILSKHPFFRNMDDGTKLSIYNKIYTKIFYLRSNMTVINRVTYTTDKSYKLYFKHNPNVNLSAHKDVDSLMNEHSLLKNLTDTQKIAIFEIAAYRVNMYRTLREDQEYYFSTHKSAEMIHSSIFQPILSFAYKLLNASFAKTYIYAPIATVNATILSVLSHTKYYEPLLIASSKLWGYISKTYTYIPLLQVQAQIVKDQNITTVYLPSLIVSHLITTGLKIEVTYNPSLIASFDLIENADYTESIIYEPSLVMTYQITT